MIGARRQPVARPEESRRFVDDLLGQLAAERYGARSWARFFARSLARSTEQIRDRPLAAIELTALHALAWRAGGPRWALASWFLCVTHLGLLGERSTLGWPNRLTVLRALLPALARDTPWISIVALASDGVDGMLARRGEETAFGAFADPIADGVFWSWYSLRWEPSRRLRWAPVTVFASTVAVLSLSYFSLARAIDYPRPVAFRYASGLAQMLLALRGWRRSRGLRGQAAHRAVRRERAKNEAEHQVSRHP